ncbi:MAG: hypothetical protein ACFFG0_05650 [Candidatus Thorarchaeota archaeon]
MSVTYSNLTPYQLRWIDERIHAEAWNKTKLLNFFQKSPGSNLERGPNGLRVNGGLTRSVEEGLEEIVITNWEKMKPGQIAGGLQDIPIQKIKLTQQTVQLMYLTTKISIPVNIIDAWNNNQYIKAGGMLSEAVDHAMSALINQVDQFIAYGDDFKTPLSHDIYQGAGDFTGLFNGFSDFTAGSANNVSAAGAYIKSYTTARKALEDSGFDTGPYFLLSDNATFNAAENGNNVYTSVVPQTEARFIINEYGQRSGLMPPELGGWISSTNAFPGSGTTTSRMAVTQPYISQRGNVIEPAMLLYIGYNFRVFPLWGGGINGNNMSYEAAIAWSGRLQEIDDACLVKSGSLTLS